MVSTLRLTTKHVAAAAAAALLLLSACAPAKEEAPAAPKYEYNIVGKVQKVRHYTDKATGEKYWGAAIKVLEEKVTGSDEPFKYFGTLRRYKLTEADAATLKRGKKIAATEATDTHYEKDEYFHGYLSNITVK